MSPATSSTLSMIPLATHHVAASTVSATFVTTPLAISPALSIAHPATSPRPPANPPTIPPAPLTASPSPPAIFPAASAAPPTTDPAASTTHHATDPAASTAPEATDPAVSTAHLAASPTIFPAHFATSTAPEATLPAASTAPLATSPTMFPAHLAIPHRPPATHPATHAALPRVPFRILSSEKSQAPINTVRSEPIKMKRSLGSIFHPTAFHATIMMVAPIIPANLVLYHRINAAPAKISHNVANQNQMLLGMISRKGISCEAAPHTKSIFPGIPPNLPSPATNNKIPTATRIIQSTFHIIIKKYKKRLIPLDKSNIRFICKE